MSVSRKALRQIRSENFRTGETVPQSGIYRIQHAHHRLPHEVTLLAGQVFPRCSKCKDAVQFQVVRHAVMIQADDSFKVTVYELPVIYDDEDDGQESLAS